MLGDPVNLVDPSGEFAVPVIVALGIGLGVYLALEPTFEKVGKAINDWWNYEPHWWDNFGNNVCQAESFDPKKWPKVKGRGKQPGYLNPEDGSVWEKDNAEHGGRKWKRWRNKRDWLKGKKREGSYDENGNRIAD